MFDEDGNVQPGRIVMWFMIALVIIVALGWFAKYNNLLQFQFFAPKQADAEREVYENTKSYKQGSKQRLSSLCQEVDKADDSHKGMINDMIKHEFVEWDLTDVPAHLRPCLQTARGRS